LGKEFTVKSSYGHVRDLPKSNSAIDIANNFQPKYEITPDKLRVVNELKQLADKADTVWLATDDDREGEAISWHLYEALNLKTKQKSDIKRIVFREITKTAILKAIQQPRNIDIDLVNAQQARRVLDRLVGFELSPLLWKKVKAGLSAGRVQSVAVRMIVEREREIEKFIPTASFKVNANFALPANKKLVAELAKNIDKQPDALAFLNKCNGASFSVKGLETKPAKKSPAPPFTTSTLQQEASRKLRFSVSRTMRLAQNLYEAGKISYMRTDSTNLSDDALKAAESAITRDFGKDYVQIRKYKTKNQSAQEAHEAIRPTDFTARQAGADKDEQRLYDLIWKRAIASQMADAELERTTATIEIKPTKPEAMPDLIAKGEVIKFEGFLKVYLESTDEDEDEEQEGMLPPLQIGQNLDLAYMTATERYTRPSARYTEASLVKELEEMGIGRPSTYAPTISTIQDRGYVEKGDREGKQREYRELTLKAGKISETTKSEIVGAEKAKLFPTDTAALVNDFLVAHFADVVNYKFTALMEEEFDQISEGKKEWVSMIRDFYEPFNAKIKETTETAERNTTRALGKDPKTGEEVFVILGKFGAFVQIGDVDQSERGKAKPPRASIRKDQRLETITLAEALELFKLPRESGMFEGHVMKVAIGRFGPYILHNEAFYNLEKNDDPYTIDEVRCIEIIEAKRAANAARVIKSFPEDKTIQVLNGRYGAYIKAGDLNVKIPKGEDPASLTLERCRELAQASGEKEKADKQAKDLANALKTFPENKDVIVLNGKYGAYIKVGDKNVKIPKNESVDSLTLARCLELANEQDKPKEKAKTTTKKTTTKKKS
jgi:DNA topoisomerase-1